PEVVIVPITTTERPVTVEFQVQLTFVPHVKVMTVPSWSWACIEPVAAELAVPLIVSLKVRLNESPSSVPPVLLKPQSVVPRLFVTRASVSVGGVKSAAPLTNETLDG